MTTEQETIVKEGKKATDNPTITTVQTTADAQDIETQVPSFHRHPGTAPIKKEFLKPPKPKTKRTHEEIDNNPASDDDEAEASTLTSHQESKSKRRGYQNNLTKRNHGKPSRGQNKNRDFTPIFDAIRFCSTVARGDECPDGSHCRYSHDVDAYLASKGPDLGSVCPQWSLYGYCKYGIKCRFYNAHPPGDKGNKEEGRIVTEAEVIKNGCTWEFKKQIRLREFEFEKCDRFVKWLEVAKFRREEIYRGVDVAVEGNVDGEAVAEGIPAESVPSVEEKKVDGDTVAEGAPVVEEKKVDVGADHTASEEPKVESKPEQTTPEGETISAPAQEAKPKPEIKFKGRILNPEKRAETLQILDNFDHDPLTIRLRPSEKKHVDFRGKTYLAPLTTVGNLPFRRMCKKLGVDITCGEMALATNLLQGQNHEWALTKRHVSEDIFGVQIAATDPITASRVCEVLVASGLEADFVDLNTGCPVDAITQMGGGSALLGAKGKLFDICSGMNYALGDIPLTVKMRTGLSNNKPIAHKWIPQLWDCGVSMITLHGRSKEQRYTKLADWKYIREIAKAKEESIATNPDMNGLLFFGNGDLLSHEEYWRNIEKHSLDGLMIGRGALIKPWIFTEIRERRIWDISSRERFDLLKDFAQFGLEYWGSDTQGVNTTRRYMCEWMSFLYRYIPVGLLEVLPQKMNDRPPGFFGRDELETLLGSGDSRDWVKISEMVLGKAPEGFKFVPKHKSNSYENADYEG